MHAITSEGGRSQFLVKLVRYIAQETKDEEFAGGIEFARAHIHLSITPISKLSLNFLYITMES